jgi:hypothetical protein
VSWSVINLPAGVTGKFSQATTTGTGSWGPVTLTLSTPSNIPAGVYNFTYRVAREGSINNFTSKSGTLQIDKRKVLSPLLFVDDKVYDGSTSVASSSCVVTNLIGTDTVACVVGSASFISSFATTTASSSVDISGLSLTGPDVGNYILSTTSAKTFATIFPKPQTVSLVLATPTDATFGDPDFDLLSIISVSTSTSGIPPTLYAGGACTLLPGTTVLHYTRGGSLPCYVVGYVRNDNLINGATTTNFRNMEARAQWNVKLAKQKIETSFTAPSNATFGDPDFDLAGYATSSAATEVYYVLTGACQLVGSSTVHYTRGGTACNISFRSNGNLQYYNAPSLEINYQVKKLSQSISHNFATPVSATFGDRDIEINDIATSTSGLAVNYYASSACSLVGSSTIHFVRGGTTCNISIRQPGNTQYLAAKNIDIKFNIAKATQTLTFELPIATTGLTDTPVVLSATSTSGLVPIFYVSTPTICSVTDNKLSLLNVGNCGIYARQGGDTRYLPAVQIRQVLTISK